MPRAARVLNGFTAEDLHKITGLSRPMIDYLLRAGFLRPHYNDESGNPRGKVRYYSYRDLVVGRTIQRFRDGGIRLGKLKAAIIELSGDPLWAGGDDPTRGLNYVVSDGKQVHLQDRDGFLNALDGSGQRSFAFVVNVATVRDEVKAAIGDSEKLSRFSMTNLELTFDRERKPATKTA